MTPQEQADFVGILSEHVTNELLKDIAAGIIPEAWEGIELRQLLADRFDHAVFKQVMTRARKRAYNNVCLERNL